MKTHAKDAVHLARLLRLDEVTAVMSSEAARDLVRAQLAGADRWPSWTTAHPLIGFVDQGGWWQREERTRDPTMSSETHWGTAMLEARHAVQFLPNHRPAVPNPRISV